jgi:hypothetical protein
MICPNSFFTSDERCCVTPLNVSTIGKEEANARRLQLGHDYQRDLGKGR